MGFKYTLVFICFYKNNTIYNFILSKIKYIAITKLLVKSIKDELMRKFKLFMLLMFLFVGVDYANSQTRTVEGLVVTVEDNEPVIGAAVKILGTKLASLTDLDGRFKFTNVPSSATKIEVTYIGLKPAVLPIKSVMKITMESDVHELEQVVVTGMTKVDKRLFTGASVQLGGDKAKMDGLADASRALDGKAAGVSVQNVSGTFGTAPKIRVRGATSIYGNSKPLWVVDGVVMEDVVEVDADALSSGDASTLISSAIAGLNADDIESFQVLKDGSATSIYGARAMAGVIVITTKKGRSGVSRISYTGEFTTRLRPNYGNFNIMNSQDQMAVYKEMEDKGWLNLADVATASSSGVYGKMYQLINDGVLSNTIESRNAFLRGYEYQNTDWFEELFNVNLMQNHSVSLSSGTDKSSYYSSVSALIDPGWTKQSKVNRFTANLNASYKILDNLTLNVITSGSYRKQRAPGTLSSDVDAVSGAVKRDFDINPYSFALNSSRTLKPNEYYKRNYADFNILHELDNNYIDLNVTDLKFQLDLRYKPIREIELAALGAIQYQTTSQEHNITDFSNQAIAYRTMPTTTIRDKNPFLYTDPDNPFAVPITVLPEGGIYKKTDYTMRSNDLRLSAAYNTVFNDKHILNVYLGSEINSIDRSQNWFRGWGLQYSMGEIPFYAYEVFKKGKEENTAYYGMGHTQDRSVAFFSNLTYSYKGIYTINGTYRYEGTNKLGRSRTARWLPTWNISGAWNMHEEKFFQPIRDKISHLALKASYSLTADRGPSWVTNSRVVINSTTPWRPTSGVSEPGLEISSLENSELTYEKKHEINIGMDLGLYQNRVNFSFDWYKRNNYDLIGVVSTQGLGGEVNKYGNVAEMKSNGVDLSLSTKNIQTKDFSWTTDFTYSHINNEITNLKNRSRAINMVSGAGFAKEGYPVRSLFSYQFMGLTDEGLPTVINEKGKTTTYDINFQERDNLDHLVYEGSVDPTDHGGFGNTFTYKNLKLNVFMTYSWGNVVRLDPVFKSDYNDLSAMSKEFKNRFMVPGDENVTDIPVIASTSQLHYNSKLNRGYNAYNYSTARVAKGDFIRMKEISLTYDFAKALISKWKLQNLSLKLQATNLFLIYADKKLNGQDPEFFNTGGVASPIPKQFTLTLRVGL